MPPKNDVVLGKKKKDEEEEEEERWFRARWPPLNHRSSLVSFTPKIYF
jgi:hypothetical protein